MSHQVPLTADPGAMADTLPSVYTCTSLWIGKKWQDQCQPGKHIFLGLGAPYHPTALCVYLPGPGESTRGPRFYLQAGKPLTPTVCLEVDFAFLLLFPFPFCPLLSTPPQQEQCSGMSLKGLSSLSPWPML